MLKVLAIDDEPLALRQLVSYIQRIPDLELVAACHSAVEARNLLSESPVDALFCDINMPDLNGLDFVRQLEPSPLVVFTTAYSEYAVEGFRVDAVDYLLKPFSFPEFQESVARLIQRQGYLDAANRQGTGEGASGEGNDLSDAVIYVRSDHRDMAINLVDIIRVQAMGEYLRIYLSSQPRPVMTLMSTKRMEEALPTDYFMRIHRSHIIALSQVAQVARGRVHLHDGSVLPIGDIYRPTFDKWLSEHRIP